MDLNPIRRNRERAIAREVTAQLLREVNSTTEAAPPEHIAHHFALVCDRLDFTPTEAEVKRILHYTSKDLARARRKVDWVHSQIFGQPYSGDSSHSDR